MPYKFNEGIQNRNLLNDPYSAVLLLFVMKRKLVDRKFKVMEIKHLIDI